MILVKTKKFIKQHDFLLSLISLGLLFIAFSAWIISHNYNKSDMFEDLYIKDLMQTMQISMAFCRSLDQNLKLCDQKTNQCKVVKAKKLCTDPMRNLHQAIGEGRCDLNYATYGFKDPSCLDTILRAKRLPTFSSL